MNELTLFSNLSFIFNLFVLAPVLIIGFLVYIYNPKQDLNKAFLLLSIFFSLWNLLNVLMFYTNNPNLFIWMLRMLISVSTMLSFSLYFLFSSFPGGKSYINKKFLSLITIACIIIAFISLTPLSFSKVINFIPGKIPEVENNIGLPFFGLLVFYLNFSALYFLIKQIFVSKSGEKKRVVLITALLGLSIVAILIFNFILPTAFNYPYFVPLGPLFTLPFLIALGYMITGYRILHPRIITFLIFVLFLIFLNLYNLAQTREFGNIIFNLLIYLGIIFLGIALLRTVFNQIIQQEKLEELNRIKTEFLSFAAHQVKAPMAIAKGYAELIESKIENVPQEAKGFANKIKESIDDLILLVDEFLDYRRIEEGKFEFNFEKVEIVSLVKEIFENLRKLAEGKNLEHIFETQVDQAYANIDKLRFSQVIQNLIDNAIKYTPRGFVKVNIFKEGNNIIIKIIDSGIGMSQELQKRLFGQFIRDPSIKKEIRGTGLGLYIAKYIVDNHKGKIWAESEGEGKGSNFYVEIPLILDK